MRVGIVLNLPGVGGGEAVSFDLATDLARLGLAEPIVVCDGDSDWARLCPERGLSFRHARTRSARSVRHAVARLDADLVHFAGLRQLTWAHTSCRKRGVPTLVTMHGLPYALRPLPVRIAMELRARKAIAGSVVLVVSAAIRDGLPWTKILDGPILLPNPLPFDPLPSPSGRQGPFTVGFLGRLSPEKDPLRAIGAFDIARKTLLPADAQLLVGGVGRLARAVVEKARRTEGVTYLGSPVVEDFLSRLDVLLITSRTEGLPRVLLEAALYRVPVVATRVGAIPDYVLQGRTGWLFSPSASETEIAGVLGTAWAADRRVVGERLFATVLERLPTREAYARTHARLYEQVIARRPNPTGFLARRPDHHDDADTRALPNAEADS